MSSPRNDELRANLDSTIDILRRAKKDVSDALRWEVNKEILKAHLLRVREILAALDQY